MQSEMFAVHAMTACEEVEVKDQRSNFGLYTLYILTLVLANSSTGQTAGREIVEERKICFP
jgi:hypothetical protein